MTNEENKRMKMLESISVIADLLEEAAGLVREPFVKGGEFGMMTCGFGWVLLGRWHDLGGGRIGTKPGQCWIVTRWRTGQGIGMLAETGPGSSDQVRLDAVPRGAKFISGAMMPFYPCVETNWGSYATAKETE